MRRCELKPFVCLGAASLVVSLGLASCAQTEALVARDLPDGSSDASEPVFTSPEGGDGASAVTRPELQCIGTECPTSYATCPFISDDRPGSLYKCDIDLSNDGLNCGVCGKVCPSFEFEFINVTSRCAGGKCIAICSSADLKDCNSQIEDGCETNVTNDDANCGACGNACPAGVKCVAGVCGCLNGKVQCNGVCIDLQSNDAHCGGCGRVCQPPDGEAPPPQMQFGCVEGECGKPKCIEHWENCNGRTDDGCEVSHFVLDPNNCGKCGRACAPGQSCRSLWAGVACGCKPDETMCNPERDRPRCADLAVDTENCGACNHLCPFTMNSAIASTRPHLNASCTDGVCGTACEEGWGDCNQNLGDGCETNLLVSSEHCGACGNACDADAGQPCINGACLMVGCDAGVTH